MVVYNLALVVYRTEYVKMKEDDKGGDDDIAHIGAIMH